MYCPRCKCEYLEGTTHCIDCHIPLVEYLPEDETQQYENRFPEPPKDLITFKRFPRQHEAEVAKGLLASNGIDAIVSWDDWGRIGLQRYGKSKHGIRLLIKEEDISKAEDAFKEAGVPLEDPPYAEMSERTSIPQSETRERLWARLLLLLFIIILLTTLIQLFY